jgi:hypothetical protein
MQRFSPFRLNIIWLAGLVAANAGQASEEEKKMTAEYYRSSPADVRRPATPSTPIRDGRPVPLAPARETEARGNYHGFGNAERNSRLGFPLGKAAGQPLWVSDLPGHITPRQVMAGNRHVVINAIEGWLLFDGSGRLVHQGLPGHGELTLDASAGLLYAPTDTGYVGAFSLDDGKRRFFLTPFFGDDFRRDFIDRRGTRMIIVSVERPRSNHSKVPANQSVIEIQDLSRSEEIAESGRLKSAEQVEFLKRKTVRLLAAMHEDTLALATDNSLSLANSNLGLEREFTGAFQPLWLSMDELSRCYLIVRIGNDLALWVVTREGERVVNISLPKEFEPIAPPVVARDHTTYIIGGDRLMAVDRLGALRWQHRETSEIAGAAVTSDGQLLVAAGPELVAFGGDGKRTRVIALENDAFMTAPASGDAGELFIAGRRCLYRIY